MLMKIDFAFSSLPPPFIRKANASAFLFGEVKVSHLRFLISHKREVVEILGNR